MRKVETFKTAGAIYTPSSLAARLQTCFDEKFGRLRVEGEIAELNLAASGHAYFVLKDREARLKAVMWKSRRAYAGTALAEGLSVLAQGRLSLYPPRGDFQLAVDYLEPRGEGALRLAFEKLKENLAAEGLFSAERKRPLPYWPARVALITSPDGAAAHDFIGTALALRPQAVISLYPVRVQGPGAAREIAQALADLNSWGDFDLIVLTRGGGSLADLWAFNEEPAVRAVAASRIVTLAAVGHSTDATLAELAADARAITPTAAAEAVFRDQAALKTHLEASARSLGRSMDLLMERSRERLREADRALRSALISGCDRRRVKLAALELPLARFEDRLGFESLRLEQLAARLGRGAAQELSRGRFRLRAAAYGLRPAALAIRLASLRKETENMAGRARSAVTARLEENKTRLAGLEARLSDLSPENILRRGYAWATRPGRPEPLTSAAGLRPGEMVAVRLAAGGFISQVKEIKESS